TRPANARTHPHRWQWDAKTLRCVNRPSLPTWPTQSHTADQSAQKYGHRPRAEPDRNLLNQRRQYRRSTRPSSQIRAPEADRLVAAPHPGISFESDTGLRADPYMRNIGL